MWPRFPARRGAPWCVNATVELLITAGRYGEARRIGGAREGSAATSQDPCNEVLIQINLAEADYNLGDWAGAWERLRSLDAPASGFPITQAGLLLQRAWIAAHDRRGAEALALWEQADIRGLPQAYRAEHFFTQVSVLLALGRVEEAEEAALAGESAALRSSSQRNAVFMLARVVAAGSEWEAAEALCREAAGHRYRHQGGDGLLLWGDCLVKLGRTGEARQAFALAIERDAESESAARARYRLQVFEGTGLSSL